MKCQQALDVSRINQGSRQVAMVDVPASINGDGTLVVFERDAVFTGSADDASARRLTIAQGDGIVRVFEDLFRMAQQLQSLFGVALLKDEPRFLYLDHGRQFFGPDGFGPVTRLDHVLECFAVFTFLTMRSSLPEMGEDNKTLVGQFSL